MPPPLELPDHTTTDLFRPQVADVFQTSSGLFQWIHSSRAISMVLRLTSNSSSAGIGGTPSPLTAPMNAAAHAS